MSLTDRIDYLSEIFSLDISFLWESYEYSFYLSFLFFFENKFVYQNIQFLVIIAQLDNFGEKKTQLFNDQKLVTLLEYGRDIHTYE